MLRNLFDFWWLFQGIIIRVLNNLESSCETCKIVRTSLGLEIRYGVVCRFSWGLILFLITKILTVKCAAFALHLA